MVQSQQLRLAVGQQDVGANVSRASRAPMDTMVVIGLTMISPASRNNSAQATAHTSARLTWITISPPARRGGANRRLVVGLATGEVCGDELTPAVNVGGGPGVEALVFAAVVRRRRGTGTAGGLDHVIDHHPVDQECLGWHGRDKLIGGHHPFDREVAAVGGHQEQVVEVGVDAGVGGVAVSVAEVEVDERGVEAQAGMAMSSSWASPGPDG